MEGDAKHPLLFVQSFGFTLSRPASVPVHKVKSLKSALSVMRKPIFQVDA